jgi:hypothetical protein
LLLNMALNPVRWCDASMLWGGNLLLSCWLGVPLLAS